MKPDDSDRFFTITAVDDATGRGVPLVEISLINGLCDYTDSNGIVAFFEPALMDRDVFFQIRSHGYRFHTLVHGRPGVVLKPVSGEHTVLSLTRINVAERLYRITGEGIYGHSMVSGRSSPIRCPWLNAGVMGQDTVLAVPYREKIFWFWGDTWGVDTFNFAVAGATSRTAGTGGLDPGTGVELTYFTDDREVVKPLCPDFGCGRVWLDWVAPVRDDPAPCRLLARYTRVASLDDILECGFALFNDTKEIFESVITLPVEFNTPHLAQHPFFGLANGIEYIYFTAGFQFCRARATRAGMTDPSEYEYFGCVDPSHKPIIADRPPACLTDPDRHDYGWQKYADVTGRFQHHLQGRENKPEWIHLLDIETGSSVDARPGSIFWNSFRKRWILIAQENIGQIWYSEADTPVGPWVYVRKVVSHSGYSFYNPTHHPFFDQQNGRIIYFEGTYTHIFSDTAVQTPRYDYNQIMYRLDLADARLFLPQPVYRTHDDAGITRYMLRDELIQPVPQNTINTIDSIDFFAMQPGRNTVGMIPVYAATDQGIFRLYTESVGKCCGRSHALFYALPMEFSAPEQQIEGIWECKAADAHGMQYPFGLHFSFSGHTLKADISPDILTLVKVSYTSETVDVTLNYEKNQYRLNAEFRNSRLAGIWRTADRRQSGTWEGVRVDFAWKQGNSSAVMPLYEYWNPVAGAYVYSTMCNPTDSTLVRSEPPVCRVWKNPITGLALDYETQPVLMMASYRHSEK